MANNGIGPGRYPEKWVVVAHAGSPLSCPVAPHARVLRLESSADHLPHARLVRDEPVPSPDGDENGDEKCFVDAYLAWREADDASPMHSARVMSMGRERFYSFLSRAKLALNQAQSQNARPWVEDPAPPSMPLVWARLGNVLFENVGETQSGTGLLSVIDLNARLRAMRRNWRVQKPKVRMAAYLGGSLEGPSGLHAIEHRVRSHFDGCDLSQATNTEALELNFKHWRSDERVWVRVERSLDPSGSEQNSFASWFMIMNSVFVVDQVVLGSDYDFRVGIYRAAFANHEMRMDTLSLIERIEQVGVDWDGAGLNESVDDAKFKFLIARRKQTCALTVKRDNRSFRLHIEKIKQVDHQDSNEQPDVTVRHELEVTCLELDKIAASIEPPADVAGRISKRDVIFSPSEVEQDANTFIESVAHLYQFVHELATRVFRDGYEP